MSFHKFRVEKIHLGMGNLCLEVHEATHHEVVTHQLSRTYSSGFVTFSKTTEEGAVRVFLTLEASLSVVSHGGEQR